MKKRFDGAKNSEQAGSQVKPSFCLAFFLFWIESARHFVMGTSQFVPVVVRIKGGGRNA
jgi:hypothetical protein